MATEGKKMDHDDTFNFTLDDVQNMDLTDLAEEILKRHVQSIIIGIEYSKKQFDKEYSISEMFSFPQMNVNHVLNAIVGKCDISTRDAKIAIRRCKDAINLLNDEKIVEKGMRMKFTEKGLNAFSKMCDEGEILLYNAYKDEIDEAIRSHSVTLGIVTRSYESEETTNKKERHPIDNMEYFTPTEIHDMSLECVVNEMFKRWLLAILRQKESPDVKEMFISPIVEKNDMTRALVKNPRGMASKSLGKKIMKAWNSMKEEGYIELDNYRPIFFEKGVNHFLEMKGSVYFYGQHAKDIEKALKKFNSRKSKETFAELDDRKVKVHDDMDYGGKVETPYTFDNSIDDEGSQVGDQLMGIESKEEVIPEPVEPEKKTILANKITIPPDQPETFKLPGKKKLKTTKNHVKTIMKPTTLPDNEALKKMSASLKILQGQVSRMQSEMDKIKHRENVEPTIAEYLEPRECNRHLHLVCIDFNNLVLTARNELLHFNFSSIMGKVRQLIEHHDKSYEDNVIGWIFCSKYHERFMKNDVLKIKRSPNKKLARFVKSFRWKIHCFPKTNGDEGIQDTDVNLATTATFIMCMHKDSIKTLNLVTGDKDFVPVLSVAKELDIHSHVIAFKEGLSNELPDYAEHVSCLY